MIEVFLTGLLTAIILELIAWLYYYFTKNPTIVDVFWPITIWGICLPQSYALHWLPFILISLWSLRLSLYLLYTRVHQGHVDPRYTQMSSSEDNKNFYFFKNFQLQGLLALILSQIFLLADLSIDIKPYYLLAGTPIALLGLYLETVADQQLLEFKKDNKGQLCETGLWKYSRHPNYVGEILFWIGLSICLWPANNFSAFSPFFLWALMHFVTIPITEQHKKKKYGALYERQEKRIRRWV